MSSYNVCVRRTGIMLSVLFIISLVIGIGAPSVSAAAPHTVTYQGSLVLSGNNVTTIEGLFEINGSIIVTQNATLTLKNAVLNITQPADRSFNITLDHAANGRPRLMVQNSTITSKYEYEVRFLENSTGDILQNSSLQKAYSLHYENSTVFFTNTTIGNSVWNYGSSFVNLTDCNVDNINSYECRNLYVQDSHVSSMLIAPASTNSSITDLAPGYISLWDFLENTSATHGPTSAYPNVRILRTWINYWRFIFYGSSVTTIDNSTIGHIDAFGTSVATINDSSVPLLHAFDDGTVYIIANTTSTTYEAYENGRIFQGWHLRTHVIDALSQDVPSANVTATNPHMPTESTTTDQQGRATLILAQTMTNSTGQYAVGTYTVEVSYDAVTGSRTVDMTSDKEITMQLASVIPEFPQLMILPILMVMAFAAILSRKRTGATSIQRIANR